MVPCQGKTPELPLVRSEFEGNGNGIDVMTLRIESLRAAGDGHVASCTQWQRQHR